MHHYMRNSIEKIEFAIIGGTGVYDVSGLGETKEREIKTPYGNVRAKIGENKGKKIAFLNRHGEGRNLPPHLINYRANIFALKKIGIKAILATNAVGAINTKMKPGDMVFASQFIDFTKSRAGTFCGGKSGVAHVDMTEPYCPKLRKQLFNFAKGLKIPFKKTGTMAVTEGPRFETPAEIKFFGKIGADLVSMTGFPEAALAREAGLCYASVCIVTNFAAGISRHPLTLDEMTVELRKAKPRLDKLILEIANSFNASDDCGRCLN